MDKARNRNEHQDTARATRVQSSNYIELLSSSDDNVRLLAAERLGEYGDAFAIPALTRTLSDGNRDVRLKAVEALSLISHREAAPALTELLVDTDDTIRSEAIWALGEIGGQYAVPALIELLSHSDQSLRALSAQALGKIGGDVTVPYLITLLEDEHEPVRTQAAQALVLVGDQRAVPALIAALRDVCAPVRPLAAQALGLIGDPSAVPELIAAIKRTDMNAERRTAEELANVKDFGGCAHNVKAALEHSESDVVRRAVTALRQIGDPVAVPTIIEVLQSGGGYLRKLAVWALGGIADIRALPALMSALSDPYVPVRSVAVQALSNIGDECALPQKVLSSNALTPAEKFDILHSLRDLRFTPAAALVDYALPAIDEYCRALLKHQDTEEEVRRGVNEVLTYTEHRDSARTLVRPSTAGSHTDESQLVRAAGSIESPVPPGEHLRPAHVEPDENRLAVKWWRRRK